MANLPTYEEIAKMAKELAEKALDEYIYKDKTLREWINIIDNFDFAIDKAAEALEQQIKQEAYVATGILPIEELKHLEEQMKKARLQLISAEQEPCEDCISRETLLKYLETITKDTNPRHYESKDEWYHDNGFNLCKVRIEKFVENLAPATPQPKMGRWLAKSFHEVYCDNCGFDFDIMANEFIDRMKYCPNCGAKMQEVNADA